MICRSRPSTVRWDPSAAPDPHSPPQLAGSRVGHDGYSSLVVGRLAGGSVHQPRGRYIAKPGTTAHFRHYTVIPTVEDSAAPHPEWLDDRPADQFVRCTTSKNRPPPRPRRQVDRTNQASFTIPYAMSATPTTAASGATTIGQCVLIQAPIGASTWPARSPITKHKATIANSGSR